MSGEVNRRTGGRRIIMTCSKCGHAIRRHKDGVCRAWTKHAYDPVRCGTCGCDERFTDADVLYAAGLPHDPKEEADHA